MVERCLIERTCLRCNTPVMDMREYCSDDCKKERKKILRKLNLKPICIVCVQPFERSGNRQKCCSDECRVKKDRLYSEKYKTIRSEQVKESSRVSMRKQRKINPEKFRQRDKKWRSENLDKIKETLKRPETKARINANLRRRNATESSFRAHNRMASGVYQALKGRKNGRKWETLVGYTLADLVRHLERQFVSGMSWDNMGEWHIDHIVPKSSFKYTDETDPEFKACWALTNLRPLWRDQNQTKHASREYLL